MQGKTEQTILTYLKEHSTMVLATSSADGTWATPVFYVNRGFYLYFLSELKTKHSQNLVLSHHAAAAVTEDHRDWRTIQGLQLQGRTYLVTAPGEIAATLAAYCAKFPAVRHILQKPEAFKGVSAARWHCLAPHTLKFTDNRASFGERLELHFKVEEKKGRFVLTEDTGTPILPEDTGVQG